MFKIPFICFNKKIKPDDFETIILNNTPLNDKQKILIKKYKDNLIENGIFLNNIRFVFDEIITYDIDTNTVNPIYRVLVPKNKKNKKIPVIDIDKPKKIMTINLGLYHTDNNYKIIKELTNKTRRGIVILINDQLNIYDDVYLVNLDNAVDFYYKLN